MEWIERLIARWRGDARQHFEAARELEADGPAGEEELAYHELEARTLEQCAGELESELNEFAIHENERLQRRVGKLPREYP
jgi:hypothetical protein